MLKKNLLVAALVASFSAPALAEDLTFSSNVMLASDYIFRGQSQTGKGPAIQGGFDLTHASGLYAGVWSSSISWLENTADNSGTEIDTYAGYAGTAGGVGYNVGFLRYNYPGDYGTNLSADTNEIYGAVTYEIVTAKVSYALGDTFGNANSKGSTYLEAGVKYPVGDTGLTVGAHYGKQKFVNNSTLDYSDYNFSVSKDFGGYVFGLMLNKPSLGAYSSTVLTLSRAM